MFFRKKEIESIRKEWDTQAMVSTKIEKYDNKFTIGYKSKVLKTM